MPVYINQSLPLQKLAEVTKQLRSRDVPLVTLLPFACGILEPWESRETNIYFPQKEEWLLEWVVQRLREDDSTGALEACCNPELWNFVMRLLPYSSSASTILRKHGILQVIARTFSRAALMPTSLDPDGDINMEEEAVFSTPRENVASHSSSSTERGSLAEQPPLLRLRELLRSVGEVLLYLQEYRTAGVREGNVVTVLRGTPEIGAQILGLYLEASLPLVQNGLKLEQRLTSSVVNVWRSCIWGNPNSKKVSMLFSTFCLLPATRLVLEPLISPYVEREMEQLISEFIFSHEVLFPFSGSGIRSTKPSSKDLKPLVEKLQIKKESLPQIFRIGITSQIKKRKPDSDTVEVIFSSITSGLLGIGSSASSMVDSDAEIVIKMLGVLVDTGTILSSGTLAELVDEISNLEKSGQGSVRWNIIEVALRLDFDIFLGRGNETRGLRLIEALTMSELDEGIVLKVVELLIDGYVKARDLGGFAKTWIWEVSKAQSRGGVWESDKVARLFADGMEKALLGGQIHKILKAAFLEENWVVIDAVLRGVRREDTEDKIRHSLPIIFESASLGNAGWRGWRALVRALQVDSKLVTGLQRKILGAMKKSATGTSDDHAKELLFASEVLMESSDIGCQMEVLNVVANAMEVVQKGWNGSVNDVNQNNLGVVMATAITGRWLGTVELSSSGTRAGYVDAFLKMAMRKIMDGEGQITGKTVWMEMLTAGVFYEYLALKDAVLAALVTKLVPFAGTVRDMETSLSNIRKDKVNSINQDDINQIEFLLESIAKYPLEAIKRVTRERILDVLVLLDAVLEVRQVRICVRHEVKGLVGRLWGVGNASSFLAINAGGFIDWVLNGGDKTCRRILRFIFATKEQERSHEFLKDLVHRAEKSFFDEVRIEIRIVNVCSIIVEEFWRAGESKSVERLRNGLLQKMRQSIEASEIDGQAVELWRRLWALDRSTDNRKEALGLAQVIIESIRSTLPKILTIAQPPETVLGTDEAKVIVETVVLLCACSKSEAEAVKTTALVVGILDSPFGESYKTEIVATYNDMVTDGLDSGAYLKCLERVVEGCLFGTGGEFRVGYWHVLKILVQGAKEPGADETSKKVVARLSTVFSKMARKLPRAETVEEFFAISDFMDIILREKKWAIVQYNIDETLASIAICASPSGPNFTFIEVTADDIFVRLCNLSRLILTLHRLRVRSGRCHLVVAALQSLLHCIHKRKEPGERRKCDRVIHPPWILGAVTPFSGNPDARAAEMPIITEKCADGFNRLLTTFCEPSASSVRDKTRRKGDGSLVNSVRDREKREVASCVGGLLGEILKGGLGGGFEGDITVSINAILEVLGPEGVKAFAKTLDREGRAMLRELWDEFNRVGGGANEKF